MSADTTWIVRPNEFPIRVSDKTLGTVSAPDKKTAQQKAEDLYGRCVIVERVFRNTRLTDPDASATRRGRR